MSFIGRYLEVVGGKGYLIWFYVEIVIFFGIGIVCGFF